MISVVWLLLAIALGVATVVLLTRLASGMRRPPPLEPVLDPMPHTSVSVVVPARNEARRIAPCLAGLSAQRSPLVEVLVVDGGSTDGTRELISRAAAEDSRLVLIDEPPRDRGIVGRPWALHHGFATARGEWVMSVDADAAPNAGMIASAVQAAERHGLDALSLGPTIVAPGGWARWLQPAFLTTLIYRTGAPTPEPREPSRVLANGQAMLIRRAALERIGGYRVATRSFCDDVTVARALAASGARVALLDGHRLLSVEMYPTGRETWRAWPRSVNLRDGTSTVRRGLDALLLVLAQALPLPLLVVLLLSMRGPPSPIALVLILLCATLLGMRLIVLFATAGSFAPRGAAYWLSPLADVAAVARVVQLMFARGREWRGAQPPSQGQDSAGADRRTQERS
jgi:dolichol-phosphate mannosyltransferase